jgi:hypothetical protein
MRTRPGRQTDRTHPSGAPQRTGVASSIGQETGVPSQVPPLRSRPDQARLVAQTTRARHRRRGVGALGSVVCRRTVQASPRLCRVCWALAGDLHLRRPRRPVGARSGKCCNARDGANRIYKFSLTHSLSRGGRRGEGASWCKKVFLPFPSRRRPSISKIWCTELTSRCTTSSNLSSPSQLFVEFLFYKRQPAIHRKKKGFHEATDYRFRGVIGQFAHISLRSFFRFPRFLSVNPPDLFYSCVTTVTVSTTTKIHFLSRSSGSVPTHPRLSRSHVLRMVCWV